MFYWPFFIYPDCTFYPQTPQPFLRHTISVRYASVARQSEPGACCLLAFLCFLFWTLFNFCASSRALLLLRCSLSFPAHVPPVQEDAPVPNTPKFLPTYTADLSLEAQTLMENGKCLFILCVQTGSLKTRGRPIIFVLQSCPWVSDSVGRAVQGMAGMLSWCFRQLNRLYQFWETRRCKDITDSRRGIKCISARLMSKPIVWKLLWLIGKVGPNKSS